MDSTAQWFYVSVLGGQKLGHCFWTEFVTFKTCKIWWSSGLLNIDVGLLGKYFLSDIRPLCCKDLVVFLFFLAESSKYSCKLFFKLLPPVVVLVYLLSQKTNNRSHYPHLFFWDSIPLIIMLLCTGWSIIDCSIWKLKNYYIE